MSLVVKNKRIIRLVYFIGVCICVFSSCAKREEYEEITITADEVTNKESNTEEINKDKRIIDDLSIQPDYIERQIGEKFNGLTIKADVMYPEKICKGTVKKYLPVDEIVSIFSEKYNVRVDDSASNDVKKSWIVSSEEGEDIYIIRQMTDELCVDTLINKDFMQKLNGGQMFEISGYDDELLKQTAEFEKVLTDFRDKYGMDYVITSHRYQKKDEYYHNWIWAQPAIYGGAVLSGSRLMDISVEFINDGIFGASIREMYKVESEGEVEVYDVNTMLDEIERRYYKGEISPARREINYIRLGYIVDDKDCFKPVWSVGMSFPEDNEYVIFIFDAQTLELISSY